MKIKLLQDVIIAYGPSRLFAGDIVDIPSAVAQPLVLNNQAVEFSPEPEIIEEAPATKGKGKGKGKGKENK